MIKIHVSSPDVILIISTIIFHASGHRFRFLSGINKGASGNILTAREMNPAELHIFI